MNNTFTIDSDKKATMITELTTLGKTARDNWGDNMGDFRRIGRIYNELKNADNLYPTEKHVVEAAGLLLELERKNAVAQVKAKKAAADVYSQMIALSIAELVRGQ